MTSDTAARATSGLWRSARTYSPLPLLAGLIILAIPTIASLGHQTWSTETGAHGPIVLGTGLWLLYHDGFRVKHGEPSGVWRYALWPLVAGLGLYTFGRAYDFISLEVAGLFAVFVAFLLRLYGLSFVARHIFPLVYLAFVIPLPGWAVDRLTAPLQLLVSKTATLITAGLGYPVSNQGVTLAVAQYQLLVEQACAGMNSLVGLTAVSLFYIYLLHRASWRYGLLLMALIVPVAIAVNVARVVALILITYYWGDEAAQGFLHASTGMVLFGVGLMMIFGLDTLFWRIARRGK